MKSSRAALAAGLMAGLAALPLTASAADAAPTGSASASALHVQISLAPLSAVNAPIELAWGQIASALATLKGTLCTSPAPGTAPLAPANVCAALGLGPAPTLPQLLTLDVAQAEDSATLNSAATDIVGGSSSSSPVKTSWTALTANLAVLQQAIAGLIPDNISAVAAGQALPNFSGGTLKVDVPVLGTATFDIFGTVKAALPSPTKATSTAVQITGKDIQSLPTGQLSVNVDPYNAFAAGAADAATLGLPTAQTSAANTVVAVKLPELIGSVTSQLSLVTGEASLLKGVVTALASAIANPSQAGSILNAVPVPPGDQIPGVLNLQQSLAGLGATINGSAGGAIPDLGPAKQLLSQLAAVLDGLNGVIDAVSKFQLPDLSSLLSSANDIATAQSAPVAGGGVTSTATATLGSLNVLPIGGALAAALNLVQQNVPALKSVNAATSLLSIDGINATAIAAVGKNATACGKGDHPFACGTTGLHSISVLGQPVNLDDAVSGLGSGQELRRQFRFPGLGAGGADGWLTLDITRGLPQIVADTDTYRAVTMAALDVHLINGCGGTTCTDALQLPSAPSAKTASPRTASPSDTTVIAALGGPGDIVQVSAPRALASVSMNGTSCNPGSPNCPTVDKLNTPGTPPTPGLTSLPSTGLFGGGALPAGFALIAVAISLRLVPGLRSRLRRMR